HVRVDSSLLTGTVVGSDYDPMLAKIIAWGPDRDTARRRADAALAHTAVLGVTTNITLLRQLLTDPQVAAGVVDTGLVERIVAEQPVPSSADVRHDLAAIAAALVMLDASREPGPWGDRTGWRLGGPGPIEQRIIDADGMSSDGGETVVVLYRAGQDWLATVDGREHHVHAVHDEQQIVIDRNDNGDSDRDGDGRVRFVIATDNTGSTTTSDGMWLGAGGTAWHFQPAALQRQHRTRGGAAGHAVVSPMPGTVVTVPVAVGDAVTAGQAVAVVEAMKMEHTLRAAADGIVREVTVAAGDRVELRQTLVLLEPVTSTSPEAT
ncbi:MAG TPA: hypothetical protein PLV68_09110, partial [Ilumatobacteraceae bacterium]|nr:hypothetical protein [Ilumatobacteraceae bacterium]